MTLKLLAFSDRGWALAQKLASALGGEAARCGEDISLSSWTAEAFSTADGLVLVGAVGIAVRAIAPYLKHKSTDPAVVVVDDGGGFAVPILSGHLGGANDLARSIAALCGAVPVITTATDVNGVFAVDEWAKRQGCAIQNPEHIKVISSKLLSGQTAYFYSACPIHGALPRGVAPSGPEACDFDLSIYKSGADCLHIVPRIAALGVGCKKGTEREKLDCAFSCLLDRTGLWEQAIVKVCSIDLKRDEPGLLAFCREHSLPFETYSAGQLRQAGGEFSASDFVLRTTGVDNVCERSAVLGSGGVLIQKKLAVSGITMALAVKPFSPDWRWRYG